MEFTPRIRQMLLVLLKEKDIISAKLLAEKVDVSKRTIQRELEYMGTSLKKHEIALCSKTGVGIWLEGDNAKKESLLQMLEGQEVIDFADQSERRKRLILELLKDKEPKKLYYFGNTFNVSEATINKDLEKIEPWFENYYLHIVKKQGLGVMLQGSEKNYRRAVREFISQNMNTPMIKRMYEDAFAIPEVVKSKSIKNIYNLLNEKILNRVCHCFASFQDKRITGLTQESYIGLVLHVTIAIERILQGEIIENNQELMAQLKEDSNFPLAMLIVNSLEAEFELEIPDIEMVYICLHIKGSKLQRTTQSQMEDLTKENSNLLKIVYEMIAAYDEVLFDILSVDEDFITGLLAHLRPTLVRLQNNLSIKNPHLDEIKITYPEIYKRCQAVGSYLQVKFGYHIPDAEIGFLCMHFGAALVRLENEKEERRIVHMALVCASGIGISRLMASKLKKVFKDRIHITTYGMEDLTPYVLGTQDFFVSSMDMSHMDCDIVPVSPLLPEANIVSIEQKISIYEKQEKVRTENEDFAAQLDKIHDLSMRIKEILKTFCCIYIEESLGFKDFLKMSLKEMIFDKERCIIAYEDVMKREKIATQVLAEFQIGLFHTRTKGVEETCIYVCIPKQGKYFSDAYFKHMRAALFMLIPEDEQKEDNSRMLGVISEAIIEDEAFLHMLQNGEEKAIKTKLTSQLKNYFKRFLDKV